ncbi:MAG: acyltransferase family protein [Sporichthyaceae bacterium]
MHAAPSGSIPRHRAPVEPKTDRAGHGRELRRDIQGLRAVAVLLVLIYHLWPGAIPGGFLGVDAFFVISGFLITGHLLATRPTTVRAMLGFWERRIRRLAPACLLVLAFCLLAVRLVGPDSRRVHSSVEIAASALNLENWFLSYRAVDYLAASAPPSPVQHYWSLAVEEQFYLLWPILLAVAAIAATRLRARFRTVVLVVLTPVVLGSFLLTLAPALPLPALTGGTYFVTPLRMWELGAGAVVAAWLFGRSQGERTGRAPVASAVSAAGLVLIAASAFAFSAGTPWPGPWSLVPVLGVVLIIGAAAPAKGWPNRLLTNRPMQYTGNLSYSIYLWHWPLIVLLPAATSRALSTVDKVGIFLATFALAALTKRYVEDRFRQPRSSAAGVRTGSARRAYVACAAATAAVVGFAGFQVLEARKAERTSFAAVAAALETDPCLGALALAPGGDCANPNSGATLPSSLAAIADRPTMWADGCLIKDPFTGAVCRTGPANAKVRVALVGNSRGGHWQPAMQRIAEQRGWALSTFTTQGCAAVGVEYLYPTERQRQWCLDWGKRVLRETTGGQFDLVVISQLTAGPPKGLVDAGPLFPPAQHDYWVSSYRDYLAQWVAAGVRVVVVRDTPMPRTSLVSVPDCLAVNRDDFAACSGPRSTWLRPDPLAEAGTSLKAKGVSVVDLTDYLCDAERCFGVVGRVPVYFDASHLSATYSETLAPALAPSLDAALRRPAGKGGAARTR